MQNEIKIGTEIYVVIKHKECHHGIHYTSEVFEYARDIADKLALLCSNETFMFSVYRIKIGIMSNISEINGNGIMHQENLLYEVAGYQVKLRNKSFTKKIFSKIYKKTEDK